MLTVALHMHGLHPVFHQSALATGNFLILESLLPVRRMSQIDSA